MRWLLPAGLLAAACPRSPEPASEVLVYEQEEAPTEVQEAVSPGRWSEPGGLSMQVPPEWSGYSGPPGSSLLVSLHHQPTGTTLEIWAFERTARVEPRPRPGCENLFTDRASHRSVPALAPAVTATCVPEEPGGPTVQGWYGIAGDREVHVEVIYPDGRMVEGRQAVEPLLSSLSGH